MSERARDLAPYEPHFMPGDRVQLATRTKYAIAGMVMAVTVNGEQRVLVRWDNGQAAYYLPSQVTYEPRRN